MYGGDKDILCEGIGICLIQNPLYVSLIIAMEIRNICSLILRNLVNGQLHAHMEIKKNKLPKCNDALRLTFM